LLQKSVHNPGVFPFGSLIELGNLIQWTCHMSLQMGQCWRQYFVITQSKSGIQLRRARARRSSVVLNRWTRSPLSRWGLVITDRG
jgi:hypothetical protein